MFGVGVGGSYSIGDCRCTGMGGQGRWEGQSSEVVEQGCVNARRACETNAEAREQS